ncbi:hypothetical protein [Candidatus Mycoplasma haematominutum]|uniref:hypothetical protein n=1 Tax=Candidatus Mycoplasma haematominutum TaxID=209446 RepID=UPI0011B38E05|nr:hypothetical protein [Candidatus Mycoplasma haematominutum]
MSSSVAIPLSLQSRASSPEVKQLETIPAISTVSINLTECPESIESSYTAVTFGENETGNLCWKTEAGWNNYSNNHQFSTFLKTAWLKGSREWGDDTFEVWKLKCEQSSSKWEIWSTSDSDTDKVVGLCDSQAIKEVPFIKKEGQNNNLTLSVCNADCWEDDTTGATNVTQLHEEKTENWKKVLFYKT